MTHYLADAAGRSRIAPRFTLRPESLSLGADEIAEPELRMTGMEQQAALLKKRMIEAATEQAVVQMSLSLATTIVFETAAGVAAATAAAVAAGMTAAAAASVVPIVGWAVAACIAIGELIGGSVAKKQIHKMIEGAKDEIKGYGERTQAAVQAAKLRAGDEEFAAAEKLAASNEPLDGLGGLGIKKFLTHTTARAQVKSVQVVGDAVLRTGQMGAKLVGDKKGEEKAKRYRAAWDRNSERTANMFEKKLQNPYHMLAEDVDAIGRTFSGQQAVHVIRNKLGSMVAAAKRDMDTFRDKTLAMIATPGFREATRTSLAKGMRGDPEFAARARELQARDKMVDSAFNSSEQVSAAVDLAKGKQPGSTSGLLSTAAAIGAFLWLRA